MSHKLNNCKTQRESASHTISTLAKKANVSDDIIRRAENGGNVDVVASQRVADALGISLSTLGKEDF